VIKSFIYFQVFLIINYSPLIKQLAEIIFQGNVTVSQEASSSDSPQPVSLINVIIAAVFLVIRLLTRFVVVLCYGFHADIWFPCNNLCPAKYCVHTYF